jgi:predicted nucleotidyltransferase
MPPFSAPAFDRDALNNVCERYGVVRLAVFGSFLHGDSRPESDLDLLVEFRPGAAPGLGFIRLQNELSTVFHRTVDLVTPSFLSPHLRGRVLVEASPLYEAA